MTVADTRAAHMVDVAFALAAPLAAALPLEHRGQLARALEAALPWLAADVPGEPPAGVHRLKLAPGGGAQALLSQRTRLVLRVPRPRVTDTLALQGTELALGELRLRVGAAQVRELQPWGTLYAHAVAAAQGLDEAGFLRQVQHALQALQAGGRAICGRVQCLEGGRLTGYSLMVDGLSDGQALRLLDSGLGAHRRLGCGLFVPHRSAAAVGSTD